MELFDGLSEAEVDQLLQRLTAYAIKLLRMRVWRGAADDAVPGGLEAQDIVHDVVLRYMDGTRSLNPEVDLATNLAGGVRSAVSSLLQRRENTAEIREAPEVPVADTRSDNPEQRATYNELTGKVHDSLLEQALEDDDLTAAVALLEERGQYTPAELAEAMNISTLESLALRRRLSRALDSAIRAVLEDADD